MVDEWSVYKHSATKLRALLYPPQCALCGENGEADQDLCAGCRDDLPWNRHACPRCALPLPAAAPTGGACASCQTRPPPFASAWAAFRYEDPMRWLHRRLKFNAHLSHTRLLGALLAGALAQGLRSGQIARPDVILVMPLHPRRLLRRGFNQSLELIRPTARRLDIPLDFRSCRRLRATTPQSGLPAPQRARNVRGAFACGAELGGRRVAIFDDVVTTGHTVAELARVVQDAGAGRVEVWSLARAGKIL